MFRSDLDANSPGAKLSTRVRISYHDRPDHLPSDCRIATRYNDSTVAIKIYCSHSLLMISAFTGFESNNKYVIKNSMGQQVLNL